MYSMKRTYRKWVNVEDLRKFEIKIQQTDLLILADRLLEKEAIHYTLEARRQIEEYIQQRPEFLTSLLPLESDDLAPPIVREMLEAAKSFGVGPMAAVAGAIAHYVGEALLRHTQEVIVENGGDIYAFLNRPLKVSLLPWIKREKDLLKVELAQDTMPISICSSSSKIGHSLSLGEGDLACVISPSGAMADAAATMAGNLLKKGKNPQGLVKELSKNPCILGGVLVFNGQVTLWGKIKIIH